MRLTFKVLREANQARLPTIHNACNIWSVDDWLLATNGEWGEFQNLYKKVRREDFPLDEVLGDLGKELADVVTYLDILSYIAMPNEQAMFNGHMFFDEYLDLPSSLAASTNEVSFYCTRVTERFGVLAEEIKYGNAIQICVSCQLTFGSLARLAQELNIDFGLATALKFNEVSERVGSPVQIVIT